MKLLQIIIIFCCLAGSALGLDLMFRLQPERSGDDTSSTIKMHAPCLDADGEPTC